MPTRRSPQPIRGFAATRTRRGVVKRAANDIERGREDTDCRDKAGRAPGDCPRPARLKSRKS
jgi:hypothetical protein